MKNCLKFGNFIAPALRCALVKSLNVKQKVDANIGLFTLSNLKRDLFTGTMPCFRGPSEFPHAASTLIFLQWAFGSRTQTFVVHGAGATVPDLLKMVCLCCSCRPGVDISHHFCLSFISFPGGGSGGGEAGDRNWWNLLHHSPHRIRPADWMWCGDSKDHQLCPPRSAQDACVSL